MKKLIFIVTIVLILVFCLAGCKFFQKHDKDQETVVPKLATPIVNIIDGFATWDAIEGATEYTYKINGAVHTTTETRVQLADRDSFVVKAVGSGYYDSNYSKGVTYFVSECTHKDADENGVCDTCGNSVMVDISFLAVNDLHGKFLDSEKQPGVDELSTYIKGLYDDKTRAEILLSSGDMWQGTVESSTNRGALITEWMNDLGFVSMTLGNHEFDWGKEVIAKNQELAEFPLLAINAYYNSKPLEGCQPSVVVERSGVKIGIIGALGDCVNSISGEFSKGLVFKSGYELTNLVKAEATKLRNEGCAFIVYSIHSGMTGKNTSGSTISDDSFTDDDKVFYDTELSNGYIDLVFEAHTHQKYIVRDKYGVYHMQGGGENSSISTINVSINSVTNKSKVSSPSMLASSTYGSAQIKDDPIVETLYNKYFPDSDPYNDVLCNISRTLYSAEICQTVADLYLEIGKTYWSKYNVVLGGGFLSLRSPYRIYSGQVTYADLFSILPFDNTIVLGKIQGKYLKSRFINTDNDRYYCSYDPSLVDKINDNSTYYIVVDSYSSTYSYNKITEVARYTEGVYARDLLADYYKKTYGKK